MLHCDEFDRILKFLRRGKWFGTLDQHLQETILQYARVKTIKAGQTIYCQEQNALGLFVVLDGQVSLSRIVDSGDEFLYFVCGPGFWFGEYAALCNKPTAVAAKARVSTRVLILPTVFLQQITTDNPECYKPFAELVLQRYEVYARSVANMAHLSPEQNLRARLIDMCNLTKQTGVNDTNYEINLTQSEVASMIGVSRQTANQLLKKLAAENVVEVSFRNVRILETATMSAVHSA